MTHFSFLQEIPEGYALGFEPWLFLHQKHLALQSPCIWKQFYIASPSKKIIAGHLHFVVDEGQAVSPFKAPFGSLQCVDRLPVKVIFDFLVYVINELTKCDIHRISIKSPPENYQPEVSTVLSTCLVNLGFHIQSEIGTFIKIDGVFEKKLNSWQARKLRQCETAGFGFRELTLNENEIDRIYTFILKCRNERGYKLSIDLTTLLKTCQEFPTRYHLFSVEEDGELCAASVAINVGNRILYNFISAHPHEYDSMSPVVVLMKGMYRFCVDNNFAQLDLGTSAIEGKPNFSLLDFKIGLGGIPSSKFTFSKVL